MHAHQQSFEARTTGFDARTTSHASENAVIAAVRSIRDYDSRPMSPEREAIRAAGERRTAALVASGLYNVRPARTA